jgi:hypothetical protein
MHAAAAAHLFHFVCSAAVAITSTPSTTKLKSPGASPTIMVKSPGSPVGAGTRAIADLSHAIPAAAENANTPALRACAMLSEFIFRPNAFYSSQLDGNLDIGTNAQ